MAGVFVTPTDNNSYYYCCCYVSYIHYLLQLSRPKTYVFKYTTVTATVTAVFPNFLRNRKHTSATTDPLTVVATTYLKRESF